MQKIGIGYENYKDFIDNKLYYVDKSLLIRDIIEKGGKVTIFTRPRRFGKTLALSMLRTFFELEYDRDGNVIDKQKYFSGKKIMQCDDKIISKMGCCPMITLSLKAAKHLDFQNSFLALRDNIIEEYSRHSYLKDSAVLDDGEKSVFTEILNGKSIWYEKVNNTHGDSEYTKILISEVGKFSNSLKYLSQLLEKHHGKKTIILLDEYDVPLEL